MSGLVLTPRNSCNSGTTHSDQDLQCPEGVFGPYEAQDEPGAVTAHSAATAPALAPAPVKPMNAVATQKSLTIPGPLTAPCTPAPPPALSSTVARQYVHRAAHAEVFLTGHQKTGENTYVLTGQWPRAHAFFSTPDGRSHDHLQACETVRQSGIYLAHTEHQVPLDHHFVMQDMTVTTHPQHLGIEAAPTDLSLNAILTRSTRGANFAIYLTITNAHQHIVATGRGHFTCVSPAVYRRIRATPMATLSALRHTPTNQSPIAFGRTHTHDLVLAPTSRPHTWLLNPDPMHPILFDHDTDHIPGMVLIEAARQATRPHLPPDATTTHTRTQFHRYVELTDPCYITITPQPTTAPQTRTYTITGYQNDEPTFTTHHTATTP
ncbi:ScbA/BarX family gamma-butyrolactone biosynthesis protein [Streptomyces sp. NPDC005865]|uniref:ScbA/BarX family gamma-butyrolactone biosynthesis protein n=1 Tax=Streptomyces sp. NPDC005865 TaxID=3155453 RepID=UPI0033F5D2F3